MSDDIKKNILEKINAHELKMRPKIYFSLQIAAVVAVALLIMIFSVLIFNFIFFILRVGGHRHLLHFGLQGYFMFLTFFPWKLLAADILAIVTLEWLLKKFSLAYKVPLAYLLGAILVLTFAVSLVLDRVLPINDFFNRRATEHRLPMPLRGFYDEAEREHSSFEGVNELFFQPN